jgi:uncharacterized protein (TIGR04255 family)
MWSWVTRKSLPKLDRPPVVEVICGLWFAPMDIDPVVAGAYWNERKADFPNRQLHPAIERATGLVISAVPRMRVWLLSHDESQLVQLQSDRFYLNWRRVTPDAGYPRFSGDTGLRVQSLREFEQFAAFCEHALGRRPVVDRVELGKVDHMEEGTSWDGLADLAVMLPGLASVLHMSEGQETAVALRFQEEVDKMQVKIAIDTTRTMTPGRAPTRGLRIDTTVSVPLDGQTPDQRFAQANEIVNSVFATLIPEAERARRFKRAGGAG